MKNDKANHEKRHKKVNDNDSDDGDDDDDVKTCATEITRSSPSCKLRRPAAGRNGADNWCGGRVVPVDGSNFHLIAFYYQNLRNTSTKFDTLHLKIAKHCTEIKNKSEKSPFSIVKKIDEFIITDEFCVGTRLGSQNGRQ